MMLAGGLPSKELVALVEAVPMWARVVWAIVWGGATMLIILRRRM